MAAYAEDASPPDDLVEMLPGVWWEHVPAVCVNKRELYLGFGIGGDRQQLSFVGSELLLRNKKERIYGVGLGINQNFEPILTFKMSWKVKMPKLKKPKITVPLGIDPTIE